jgi:hypothetical protein
MILTVAIAEYVARKRSEGMEFEDGAKCLQRFSSQLGDVPLHRISALNVIDYLDGSSSTSNAWHLKSRLLIRFFEHWAVRGEMPALLMLITRLAPCAIRDVANRSPNIPSWLSAETATTMTSPGFKSWIDPYSALILVAGKPATFTFKSREQHKLGCGSWDKYVAIPRSSPLIG